MGESDKIIRGIIFDLDGTLYHMKWYMKALITLKLFPNCLRLPRYMSARDSFAGKDMENGEKLMDELSKRLAEKCFSDSPDKMRDWIYGGFYRQFISAMPLMKGRREGLTEMLLHARSKGIKLAVLSDYACIDERLKGLKIDAGLFDIIASSEQAGALKPCPRPLAEIAESWSFNPDEILVVGDRSDTDGVAAKQAGMNFLQISDKKKPPSGSREWEQVKSYINSLNAPV